MLDQPDPSMFLILYPPDVEDVVEGEDLVVNSPVPADTSLGMPTAVKQTLPERLIESMMG